MDTNELLTGKYVVLYSRRPVDDASIKPWNRDYWQPMVMRKQSRVSFKEEPLSIPVDDMEGLLTDKTSAPDLRYLCNEIRPCPRGNTRGCEHEFLSQCSIVLCHCSGIFHLFSSFGKHPRNWFREFKDVDTTSGWNVIIADRRLQQQVRIAWA